MEGRRPTGLLHSLANKEVRAVGSLLQVHIGVHPGGLILTVTNMCFHHSMPCRDRAGRPITRGRWWCRQVTVRSRIRIGGGRVGGVVGNVGLEEVGGSRDHGGGGG